MKAASAARISAGQPISDPRVWPGASRSAIHTSATARTAPTIRASNGMGSAGSPRSGLATRATSSPSAAWRGTWTATATVAPPVAVIATAMSSASTRGYGVLVALGLAEAATDAGAAPVAA